MINLFLACVCFLFFSGLGSGADMDNYGCSVPTTLGCFPQGSLVCVNPLSDANNCQTCGFKCALGGSCTNVDGGGTCGCPVGDTVCNGTPGTTTPGTCTTTTVNACPCDPCAAGSYCLIASGAPPTCTPLVGCVATNALGVTPTQVAIYTAATTPGSTYISAKQCNYYCTFSTGITYFTLVSDTNFVDAATTICTCYSGILDSTLVPASSCFLGDNQLDYYGSTACTDPADPLTCGSGSWQVYSYVA
jgi:hypothetical protein